MSQLNAIDCWVNPFTPEIAEAQRPEFLVRVATDYFHRADEVFQGTPLDQMVGMMDAAGIGAGLLTIDAANPAPMAEAAAKYGERFLLSAVVDPLHNAIACAADVARTQHSDAIRHVHAGVVERAIADGPQRMSAHEKSALLGDALSLSQLHFEVWTSPDAHADWIAAREAIANARRNSVELVKDAA